MTQVAKSVRAKRRLKPEEHFIQIYKVFLDEPAWLALPMGARCLYILLKSYYNGRNNAEIFLSVREAARRLGCSNSSAARWFSELIDKGFIRSMSPGCLGIDGHGLAACWRLTELGYRGLRPSREFKDWKRPEKTKSRTQI